MLPLEDIKNRRRPPRIGTVVKGERDRAIGAPPPARDCQPLRQDRKMLVGYQIIRRVALERPRAILVGAGYAQHFALSVINQIVAGAHRLHGADSGRIRHAAACEKSPDPRIFRAHAP